MTASEFSNEFDVLYNNVTSNQAPGLNEFEKSVFLTKAQTELIFNYFNPKSQGNAVKEGFDDSAIRQMNFSNLIQVDGKSAATSATTITIDPRSTLYEMPDALMIVNEALKFYKDGEVVATRQIIPINYQEYSRLMSKPFKEPLKWQAWRLINSSSSLYGEIVTTSKDDATYGKGTGTYTVRYIRRPMPIILTDFSNAFGEDISIGGYKGNESFYTGGIEGRYEVNYTLYHWDETYDDNWTDSASGIVYMTEKPSDTIVIGNYTYKVVTSKSNLPQEKTDDNYAVITYKWEDSDKGKCCELDEGTHEAILQRAVELAKIAWGGDNNQTQLEVQAGKRSE